MMYLSKVTLKPSAQTAIELGRLNKNGAYSAHQLIWRLFTENSERNFLFRQEIDYGGMPNFYVLSEVQPYVNDAFFNVQTKELNPQLEKGQVLGFKLRANPTVCINSEEGKSKRHDVLMHTKMQQRNNKLDSKNLRLLMDQSAQNWFANKDRLHRWGISLGSLPEISSYTQHKSKKKNGRSIQFSSVDFTGLIRLVSPEKFLCQYKNGFGRAKSLGCGLMLIRRV